jgi:hypothetical protein
MVFCLPKIASAQPTAHDKLSGLHHRLVHQSILPKLQNGDDWGFYNEYGELLDQAPKRVIDLIEVAARKQKVKSPFNHFIDLKIKLIEQDEDPLPAKYTLKQAIYLVTGFNYKFSKFIEKVEEHPFMIDPIEVPNDWRKARDLFWESHVNRNELSNHQRLIEYANNVLSTLNRHIRNTDDNDALAQLDTYKELTKRMLEIGTESGQREIEARLIRFEKCIENFQQAQTFENQLIDSMNISLDSEAIVGFLNSGASIDRKKLQQPGLANEIVLQLQKLKTSHPKILEQARLFRSGSHWWMRGRYGRSTLAEGLLKPSSALTSISEMNSLYMPRKRPTGAAEGVQNSNQNSNQTIKRRHFYTWAVEEEPLLYEIVHNRSRETKPKESNWVAAGTIVDNVTFFY